MHCPCLGAKLHNSKPSTHNSKPPWMCGGKKWVSPLQACTKYVFCHFRGGLLVTLCRECVIFGDARLRRNRKIQFNGCLGRFSRKIVTDQCRQLVSDFLSHCLRLGLNGKFCLSVPGQQEQIQTCSFLPVSST